MHPTDSQTCKTCPPCQYPCAHERKCHPSNTQLAFDAFSAHQRCFCFRRNWLCLHSDPVIANSYFPPPSPNYRTFWNPRFGPGKCAAHFHSLSFICCQFVHWLCGRANRWLLLLLPIEPFICFLQNDWWVYVPSCG